MSCLILRVIVYTITTWKSNSIRRKDALNIRNHDGLSLALAADMAWEAAFVEADDRFPYDEIRMNAIVPLRDHLFFVTFTMRGEKMRVISLRYARKREVTHYVQNYR